MQQYLVILGRQPALGLAELEAIFGAAALQLVGNQAVVLTTDQEVPFSRLGGSIKLTRVLKELDTTDWLQLEKYLLKTVPEHLQYLPDGKLQLGLSAYGLPVSIKQMTITSLSLKKIVKRAGRSVRVIPNKEVALSSAQVLHNHLTGPLGWELVFVRNGQKTYLTQTMTEQDIEAYSARDQARPKRDAKVGMLPPKLAQIIVNLSLKNTTSTIEHENTTVLDPFCGTGVVLQESLLMGVEAYGSDLEERMVDYSRANIEWLQHVFQPSGTVWRLEQGDATTTEWHHNFDAIACETYLGQPFTSEPPTHILDKVVRDVDHLHYKFLQNVARQTKSAFRMCIAVPAWRTKSGFRHLPTLDALDKLGYTRVSFVHAGAEDLIYHREGQIVARELVVLERK